VGVQRRCTWIVSSYALLVVREPTRGGRKKDDDAVASEDAPPRWHDSGKSVVRVGCSRSRSTPPAQPWESFGHSREQACSYEQ